MFAVFASFVLVSIEKNRKEKTAPFGVNFMRSQVLYQAAQRSCEHTKQSADNPHRCFSPASVPYLPLPLPMPLPMPLPFALPTRMLCDAPFSSGLILQLKCLNFALVAVWDCDSLCPASTIPRVSR